MGSIAHCQALRREGSKVAAMISLEMLGFTSDAQAIPLGVQVRRSRGDFRARPSPGMV